MRRQEPGGNGFEKAGSIAAESRHLCGSDKCTFKIAGSSIVAGKNDRITISKGKFTK